MCESVSWVGGEWRGRGCGEYWNVAGVGNLWREKSSVVGFLGCGGAGGEGDGGDVF